MTSRRRRRSARKRDEIELAFTWDFQLADDEGSDLRLVILHDRNATVAQVSTPWGESATGSAKRNPGDVHDPETGAALAAGRALEALGTGMQARAADRVLAAYRADLAARSARIRRTERRVLQHNSPGNSLSTEQVRDAYGGEAAQRHQDRADARVLRTRREVLTHPLTVPPQQA